MSNQRRKAAWLGAAALLVARPGAARPASSSQETVAWFQATEQKLMDSIGAGDTAPWERVMDEACIVTSEEGELISRQEFLKQLKPLPSGLAGGIQVKELTVQEFPAFASVRFLADEWEVVFGQRLVTQYRMTERLRALRPARRMDVRDGRARTSHADPGAAQVRTAGLEPRSLVTRAGAALRLGLS